MRIEEKYEDVLQNIESGVVSVYHAHPELTDWDVEVAYEALMQFYQRRGSPEAGRPASTGGHQAEVVACRAGDV